MDLNNKQSSSDRDCICPNCFKQTHPAVMEPESVEDGIRRRGYLVWCPNCDQAYLVIQFFYGGRWGIEKFVTLKPLYIIDSPWKTLQLALPEDQAFPVIQTGPGGDYAKKTTDQQLQVAIGSFNQILTSVVSCGEMIKNLLNQSTHD